MAVLNRSTWRGMLSTTVARFAGLSLLPATLVALSPIMSIRAADVVWTGGGATADWCEAANWQTGSMPTAGDVAVIPDSTEVLVNGATVVSVNLNILSGIRLEGEGSVLCISNLATNVELTVPLSGNGSLHHVEQVNKNAYHELTLNADNSNFTGTFCATNAGLYAAGPEAFGGQNGGRIYLKLAGTQRFGFGGGTYYNDVCIDGAGYGNSFFIAYRGGTWKGNIEVCGSGIAFHANTDSNRLTIDGDVTVNTTGGNSWRTGNGYVRFNGAVNVLNNTTTFGNGIELGGKPNSKRLGTYYATGTLTCYAPNLFANGYNHLNFGNNSSFTLDLNGYDQKLGRIYIIKPSTVTSSSPAQLTLDFIMQKWDNVGYTYYTDNSGADLLAGHVSYLFCPTSDTTQAHYRYGRLQNMNCTTDGRLAASFGCFVIDETATFSNLTELVAFGTLEHMKVNSEGINPVNGLKVLAVSNTATMVFKDDMIQKTRDAHIASTAKLKIGSGSYVRVSHVTYLDGQPLTKGVYGKVGGTYADGSAIPSNFQLPCLTGDGWLETDGIRGLTVSFR